MKYVPVCISEVFVTKLINQYWRKCRLSHANLAPLLVPGNGSWLQLRSPGLLLCQCIHTAPPLPSSPSCWTAPPHVTRKESNGDKKKGSGLLRADPALPGMECLLCVESEAKVIFGLGRVTLAGVLTHRTAPASEQ